MTPFVIALIALLFLAALFIWTLIRSRVGHSSMHRLAFYSGIIGLAAIPCWILGFVGMLAQFMFGSFASPSGILLISSTVTLLLTAATCLYSQSKIRSKSGAA